MSSTAHVPLQAVLDSLFVFVGVLSTDGVVLSVNRAPLDVAGLPPEDVIGQELGKLDALSYSGDVQRRVRDAVRRASLGEVVRWDEHVQIRPGAMIWVDVMFSPVRDAAGNVIQIIASATDITERRNAELALARAHERLQHLSRRLLEVQETERRTLARELHDEIGQALTAARLNLQVLAQDPDPAVFASRVHDTSAIVERAIGQVRSLSLQLRPPLLDDFGLVPALRWLLDQQAQRAGFTSECAAGDEVGRLDPVVEIACFRVAQEALNNIARHASARTVTLDLRRSGGRLQLLVRDDGAGFDVADARARAAAGGSLGLLGMEERAALAGGGVEWISRPGEGTEVRAWFPARPRPQ